MIFPELPTMRLVKMVDKIHDKLFNKSNTNILFAMIYGNDFRELCVLEGIDNDNCELFAILNKHRVRLLENNSLLTRPNIDVVPSGDQYAQLAVDCIVQSLIYTLLGVDYTMHSPSLLDSVPDLPDYSELAVLSRFLCSLFAILSEIVCSLYRF